MSNICSGEHCSLGQRAEIQQSWLYIFLTKRHNLSTFHWHMQADSW